ncbi:MAG: DUF5681 domain-containing protein [Roseiarcus sp.]
MSKHDPIDGRSKPNARNYEVGYSKPPKSSQFQPRQSGNPSGKSKVRASYAALTRRELDKTFTFGRGDNSRTMTKREVVAAQLRKAVKRGDIEAIKLAMLIDQDPASDEPIDEAKELRLFWAKFRKNQKREFEQREEETRRLEESSTSQHPNDEGASSDDVASLDPDEIPNEEHDDEQA